MIMIKDNHIDFVEVFHSNSKTKQYLNQNNKKLEIIVENTKSRRSK